MDDRYLIARLDIQSAALESILRRQSILARMIADPPLRYNYAVEMSEALDAYIEAIEKIKKEYEDEQRGERHGT